MKSLILGELPVVYSRNIAVSDSFPVKLGLLLVLSSLTVLFYRL